MARPKQQRMIDGKIERALADADGTGASPKGAAATGSGTPAKNAEKAPAAKTAAAKTAPAKNAPAKKGRPTPKRPAAASSPYARETRPAPVKQAPRSGRPDAHRRAGLGDWIRGARPLTLPLAIAPVALGTGAAALLMESWYYHWARAVLCLIVALALQIAVNYANDYSDGVRGTDANRQGPARLVGSGLAKPRTVLVVAIVFFAIAAAAGVILTVRTGAWWLLAVGAVCIAAAWFYTGGRRPYGYAALGEVAAFLFFGPVAVAGTTFVQAGRVNLESWLGGVSAGLFALAVLVANNLRDREKDALVGKRTLAVLIGSVPSRVLYGVAVLAPFGILALYTVLYPISGFTYFALLAGAPAVLIVATARSASELVTALKLTTLTALVFGLGLGAALAIS